MKFNFILKYKIQFIVFISFIFTGLLGVFLFHYLNTKKEKETFNEFYLLQKQLKEKVEKIKSEKKTQDEKKPETRIQELIKKDKKVINKSDLEEKLKVEVEDYKNFISQNKGRKSSFIAALDLGALYIEAKDFESVESIFSDVAQNFSNSLGSIESLILVQLGDSLIELKKWERALFYFNKILKNKKNQYLFPVALLKSGLCYEKLNQRDQAISSYKKLIKDFPKSSLVNYAHSYLNLLFLSQSNQKVFKK